MEIREPSFVARRGAIAALTASLAVAVSVAGSVSPYDPALSRPFVFKDSRTSITFYVESDGHHVAAIDVSGRLVWIRTPYGKTGNRIPIITRIEIAEPSQTELADVLKKQGFNSRHSHIRIWATPLQFGFIDEETGDFILEGSD